MSIKDMTVVSAMITVLLTVPISVASAPRIGGTIAVTAAGGSDRTDPLKQISIEAVTVTLGNKGFTILDDPDHAAFIAEVVTTRTEVGTSLIKGRTSPTVVTGMAVTIPTSRGKSVVVPLQRTELEIRVRRRGERLPFWHGAAVTVRSAGVRGATAEQLATTLSQAALGPYPVTAAAAISIP